MKGQVPILSRIASLASAQPAAWAAAVFALALVVLASGVDGYSHLQHPVAWLGAEPIPNVAGFNLLVFVLPGLLVAWTMLRLRTALPSLGEGPDRPVPRWSARLGAQMALLSALAFAMQGVLPLDADDLDGVQSGRHATAWMAWWIAFATGAALLAIGLRGVRAGRRLAATSALAAVLVPACALALPQLLPAGLAQRLAFAVWFAWAIHAGAAAHRPVSRNAASATGS